MQILFVMLVSCHVVSSVKYSLKYFLTATAGIPDFPEFVGAATVNEVQVGYCDSSIQTAEPKQDWMQTLIKDDPQHLKWYSEKCLGNQRVFRANIDGLRRRLNQTKGKQVLQRMNGCSWDDETGEIKGFNQYGYNGEDFIALDLQTLTWVAPVTQAVITKLKWDTEKARLDYNKDYYIHMCPEWLKKYVRYGKSFLQRTERPSVSILQKSPSPLVTCHATGFYPDTADLYWRKDGYEFHEGVDKGEILPNPDGTFQMSAELNISLISPEEWRKYDCTFQLSGVEEDVITKLKETVIRTNYVPPSTFPVGPVVGAVVVLLVLFLVVAVILFLKKKNVSIICDSGFRLVRQ
ncbi:major histocompatibility complex class I-related gene protein-like isoform X2 [Melanotaenia boesemani]|uniref:major histocompatibility complex class I-related gene protein-like isoform X2 n=1 Tax=Melanotaenia boesemani TaxID=1250792 RepID=UPI001C0502D3|nr:major histocompatibility complex class I-related gene protein-like isoform X2 [Melanotaenia boesemani]